MLASGLMFAEVVNQDVVCLVNRVVRMNGISGRVGVCRVGIVTSDKEDQVRTVGEADPDDRLIVVDFCSYGSLVLRVSCLLCGEFS